MSRHLKNIIKAGIKAKIGTFVPLPAKSTPHSKGVCYFEKTPRIATIRGALDLVRIGQQRRKRIIVRPSRRYPGLYELYTYHFPTKWSAGCVANRELIKEAQRRAHALEHDFSTEGLEWRIRFFSHYFKVVKGGAAPAPGMKAYSRFYQFAYVSIYRDLKSAALQAEAQQIADLQAAEDVSFEPISTSPSRRVSDEFAPAFIHRPSAICIVVHRRRRFEGISKAFRRQVLVNLPFT